MPFQPTDTPKTDQIEPTEPTSARAEVLARLLSQADSKTTELGQLRAWQGMATTLIQQAHEYISRQAQAEPDLSEPDAMQTWQRGRRFQAEMDADWFRRIAELLRIELKG